MTKQPRRGLRTLVRGAIIGAVFGFVFAILINQPPENTDKPQTAAAVFVAHLVYLGPFALVGAAMGVFSGTEFKRISKTVIGFAIGALLGFVCILASYFVAGPSTLGGWIGGFFSNVLPWSLIWGLVGFFSERRRAV